MLEGYLPSSKINIEGILRDPGMFEKIFSESGVGAIIEFEIELSRAMLSSFSWHNSYMETLFRQIVEGFQRKLKKQISAYQSVIPESMEIILFRVSDFSCENAHANQTLVRDFERLLYSVLIEYTKNPRIIRRPRQISEDEIKSLVKKYQKTEKIFNDIEGPILRTVFMDLIRALEEELKQEYLKQEYLKNPKKQEQNPLPYLRPPIEPPRKRFVFPKNLTAAEAWKLSASTTKFAHLVLLIKLCDDFLRSEQQKDLTNALPKMLYDKQFLESEDPTLRRNTTGSRRQSTFVVKNSKLHTNYLKGKQRRWKMAQRPEDFETRLSKVKGKDKKTSADQEARGKGQKSRDESIEKLNRKLQDHVIQQARQIEEHLQKIADRESRLASLALDHESGISKLKDEHKAALSAKELERVGIAKARDQIASDRDQIASDRERIRSEHQTLQSGHSELRDKHSKLQREHDTLRADSSSKYSDLSAQHAKLMEQHQLLKIQLQQEQQKTQAEKQKLYKELRSLNTEKKAIESGIDSASKDAEAAGADADYYEACMAQVKKKIEQVESHKKKELDTQKIQLDTLHAEALKAQKEQSMGALEAQQKTARQDKVTALKELEVKLSGEKLVALSKQEAEANQKYEALKQKHEQASSKKDEFEAEVARLKESLETTTKQRDDVMDFLEAQSKKMEELNEENERLDEKNKDLVRGLIIDPKRLRAIVPNLDDSSDNISLASDISRSESDKHEDSDTSEREEENKNGREKDGVANGDDQAPGDHLIPEIQAGRVRALSTQHEKAISASLPVSSPAKSVSAASSPDKSLASGSTPAKSEVEASAVSTPAKKAGVMPAPAKSVPAASNGRSASNPGTIPSKRAPSYTPMADRTLGAGGASHGLPAGGAAPSKRAAGTDLSAKGQKSQGKSAAV